jgi:hypothetical protein
MPSSISIQLNQEKAMSKNQYFLLLVLAFVIGSSLGVYWPVTAQEPQIKPNSTAPETVDAPKVLPSNPRRLFARNVVFSYQPDSPLEVVSVVDAEESGQEQIKIALRNVNAQAIRAFTLEMKSYLKPGQAPSITYLSPQLIGYEIQPNAVIKEYLVGDDLSDSEMQINVNFIEFADGTTWGEDKSQFHQSLLGFREGFLALVEKLIEQVEVNNAADGILADIDRSTRNGQLPLENNSLAVVGRQGVSPRWQDGFHGGLRTAKSTLKGLKDKKELVGKLYELRNLMQSLGAGQNDTK